MTDVYVDTYLDTYGSTMALRHMWDAAFPPASPPRVAAVAGYIGPAGATPHVWTEQEWADALRRSGARYKLPIYVTVPPTSRDPVAAARFCLDWAQRHGQPTGTLIALDYETAVSDWEVGFDREIVRGGYRTVLYGTRRTVLQNPEPSGGYWTATWNNIPHLDAGATITQYGGDTTLGQPWDISLVADTAPLWDTQGDTMSAVGPASWDDADWKAWDERRGIRMMQFVGGKTNTVYNTTTVGVAAPSLATVGDKLDAILNAVDQGLTVTFDPSSLTADQLLTLGKGMATTLIVEGMQVRDNRLIVTLAVA